MLKKANFKQIIKLLQAQQKLRFTALNDLHPTCYNLKNFF